MIDVEPMILDELQRLSPPDHARRDWGDVLSRARGPRSRRRGALLAVVSLAALAVVALALAATSRWHFFADGRAVTLDPRTGRIIRSGIDGRAVTTVRYGGQRWRIELYLAPGGIGATVYGPNNQVEAESAGGLPVSPHSRNRLAYLAFGQGPTDGTLVFGAASSDTAAVRVSSETRSWTTTPTPVAPILHSTASVWEIVVPTSRLIRIEAVNHNGHVTQRLTLVSPPRRR